VLGSVMLPFALAIHHDLDDVGWVHSWQLGFVLLEALEGRFKGKRPRNPY
jgi:hypothetical protein